MQHRFKFRPGTTPQKKKEKKREKRSPPRWAPMNLNNLHSPGSRHRAGCPSRWWRFGSTRWGWWCCAWWGKSWHHRQSQCPGTAGQHPAAAGSESLPTCPHAEWWPSQLDRANTDLKTKYTLHKIAIAPLSLCRMAVWTARQQMLTINIKNTLSKNVPPWIPPLPRFRCLQQKACYFGSASDTQGRNWAIFETRVSLVETKNVYGIDITMATSQQKQSILY